MRRRKRIPPPIPAAFRAPLALHMRLAERGTGLTGWDEPLPQPAARRGSLTPWLAIVAMIAGYVLARA